MLTSCEYRLKTTLALVRTPDYITLTAVEQPAHTCQDVTTRGEYYPDKNMATAAVSQPTQCCRPFANVTARTLRSISASPARPRKALTRLLR
jgi:hypothetical protein